MSFLKKNFLKLDRSILLLTLALLGVGVVFVYSSSFIFATESRGDGFFYLKRQLLFALIGYVLLLAITLFPFEKIQKLEILPWLFFGALTGLTLVPGIGVHSGGASRWIHFGGGFYLEPSEFLKISTPLLMSFLIFNFENSQEKVKSFLLSLLLLFPLPILLKQPDFGSFFICASVIFSLLFIFGLRWFWVLSGTVMASLSFYILVMQVAYRKARIMAFLDPWSTITTGGYQIIQSLLSFYSGGLFGSGLGEGQGKLYFLPEAHTDFILSVLGEETGFLGTFFVFVLYGYLIFKTFQISARIPNIKAQIISIGLSTVFALQVLVNWGVVFGVLPTKGLALPFMSYGGSSIISTCILFGLLLNIQKTFLPKIKN